MLPVIKKLVVLSCFFSLRLMVLLGQNAPDLLADAVFFHQKLPEMKEWLVTNGLQQYFKADSVFVSPDRVTLYLSPHFSGQEVCDSTQIIWQQLENSWKQQTGKYFHERVLRKWAFLCEIDERYAQVVVLCRRPAHFMVQVSSVDGKIGASTRTFRSPHVPQVGLSMSSFNGIYADESSMLLPRRSISQVIGGAKNFIINWYKNKGTPILWRARIDTSYSFEDEFVVEVTHLSHQICPDGYFEYHKIYVQGIQQGEDVFVRWEFQGKYGSGVIFPPRKNDYKDLITHYKDELENYQKMLFKHLITYLSRI